jgi:hypothetical protein
MAYKYKGAYYSKNREEILRKKKEYYQKNKITLRERMKLYGRKWYKENKEKIQKLHKEYYWNNKEKESQRHKIIYLKNRDGILERSRRYYGENKKTVCLRHKKYNEKNREKLLAYKSGWQKIRRKENFRWRLDENMGVAIWKSLKNKKAGKKWGCFVEYTLDHLIKHLETKFDEKMNWGNYGNYWAVDHKKPKSLFMYSSEKDEGFKQCWALENLQPLEKIENIKKGNRYIS